VSPWIILDRDGVINEDSDAYIKSPEEWHPIPGSLEAIAKLHQAGFKIAVATNQSGIARGYFSLATLEAMHAKMQQHLAALGGKIDALAYCPHGPDEDCACRKPKPGLLHSVAQQLQLPLSLAYFVGDTAKDIEAANRVGCQPILVKTGKGELTLNKLPELAKHVPIYDNLAAFVDRLLKGNTHA
jgi:D-glycero-D-manno-heptose 1,7-bisphosphate phosphatase